MRRLQKDKESGVLTVIEEFGKEKMESLKGEQGFAKKLPLGKETCWLTRMLRTRRQGD